MPRFTIKIRVTNNSGFDVKVHIGASLVGQKDSLEFYNTSDDITRVLGMGKNEYTRYLNTDLGRAQKYNLIIVLWEGEKTIGTGKRYATVTVTDAVEKKKKKKKKKNKKKQKKKLKKTRKNSKKLEKTRKNSKN